MISVGEGRGFRCVFHLLVGNMRVDFCGSEIGVSQNFFQNPYVDRAVLIHQRGGGVAQFVGGIALIAESCVPEPVGDDLFNPARREALALF